MNRTYIALFIAMIFFISCASWPWKFDEGHGKKAQTGESLFSQLKNSLNDSEDTPDERCSFVPDPGECEDIIEKYFFNPETNKCEIFIWGGCNGIVPFETLEVCTQACE